MGDFNAILGAHEHEKNGGCVPLRGSCMDFQNMIYACQLFHLPSQGLSYTWSSGWCSRGLVERRLDRVLCNSAVLDVWNNASYRVLSRLSYDHSPLLVNCNFSVALNLKPFSFQPMWFLNDDFFFKFCCDLLERV